MEASSKENLVKMQILTNQINGKAYNYQTPQKEGSKWVVWFFANWQDHTALKEKDLDEMLPVGENLTKAMSKK